MIIKHAFDGLCVCLVVPPSQILFKSPSARQDIWKRQGSGGWQRANCISCKITGYHSARADAHGWRELSGDAASASHKFILGQQPGEPSPFGLWPRGHLQPPAPVPGFREALTVSQQEGRRDRPLGITGRLHEGAAERSLIAWCCWQMDFESGSIIFMT